MVHQIKFNYSFIKLSLTYPFFIIIILMRSIVLGDFSFEVVNSLQLWRSIWLDIDTQAILPPLPPLKKFKPKFDLPILVNYKTEAPSWFWHSFPSNLMQPAQSMVNADKLKAAAIQARYPDTKTLQKVYKDLKFGANIGCVGKFRLPSSATNAPSAFKNGPEVTDAIADWLTKGFAFGPVLPCEVPSTAKFSGIMTRPKPNGSVRIILNLSAPLGTSVNEGIDKEQFPVSMSSTSDWLRALHKAGRRARFCKIDWSDAYKHIAVHHDDTNLQWFKWGGMAFKELCLIFGGVSSAGIFDRTNKIVIFIAQYLANMDPDQVCQVLDDCCAAGPENSNMIDRFDECFNELAGDLGIKLAPRDDPEKSFAPCQKGVVLGIEYDSITWSWALPHVKLIRLLHTIKFALESDFLPQDTVWSLAGKIVNVKPLIPQGKFNIDHIVKANSFSKNRNSLVPISSAMKKQLYFWYTMLQVCSGRGSLVDPDASLPPWALDVYTDAAGGSFSSKGHGAGVVASDWWAFIPWSKAINLGHPGPTGKSLARSMSALELIGPLLAISTAYEKSKNTSMRIWVDNSGSVFIWKKGYSNTCPLSTTLVKAIAAVAAGLGCRVDIVKITRCSTPMADMADAISKGAFTRFWTLANNSPLVSLPLEPGWVPASLLKWISVPSLDEVLGHKILLELAKKTKILGYNC